MEKFFFKKNRTPSFAESQNHGILNNIAINRGKIMDLESYFNTGAGREIMDIAYSVFPGIPGNSEIHFREAIRRGFHGLKADMRLSRDGEIILCHDDGYTFDEAGRITAFEQNCRTAIRDLSAKEILKLRFAATYGGVAHAPCTLETMLGLCRDSGRIAYLTLRSCESWRAETIVRMTELLRRFEMTGRTIINIFPPGFPEAVRMVDDLCPGLRYCNTMEQDTPLNEQIIEDSAARGFRIICLCGLTDGAFDPALAVRAAAAGIHIWCWGLETREALTDAVRRGATGFQMYMPEGTVGLLAEMFPGRISLS